jgi:mono/diheme cytochrome c family protein
VDPARRRGPPRGDAPSTGKLGGRWASGIDGAHADPASAAGGRRISGTFGETMKTHAIPGRNLLRAGLLLLGGLAWSAAPAFGSEPEGDSDADLAAARSAALKTYKDQVAPFINTYCIRCHGEQKKKGGVTFEYAVKSPATPSFRPLWKKAVSNVKAHDMPPEKEETQPSDSERQMLADWVAGMKYLSPKDPGEYVIRRLSRIEFGNTLRDLFGVDPGIVADLPEEVFGAGYTNSVSPLLMEKVLSVANEVLSRVLAPAGAPPTAAQTRLFGVTPGDEKDRPAAAREIARRLARLAYRRPPSEEEVQVLMRVFTLASAKGRSYPEALRLMLKALLVSPQFLFITPDAEATPGGDIVPLGDHQLASRLSYLLWATPPDRELSALADAGTLHDPAVLAVQARRLLADPRSRALFDGFGTQWLGLDKLSGKTFDPSKFPQMTAELRAAMVDEARLLFESILRENRNLQTFIDCDYTFLNETLAPIYGLEKSVRGPAMSKVPLTDQNRGGILAMPGILAMTSYPNRTSPVNRGVWVLEQILGEVVPPPPANVPSLEKQDRQKVAGLTLRQRTELHRSDPTCASCHKVLDPIGFGLENFDAIGRWRERDEAAGAIDPSGELPGSQRFGSPKELKRIIASRTDDFCRTLAGKLLAYALCRQLEGYDEIVVDQLVARIAKDDYRFETLVIGVVTSYPFTHRRVNEQKGTAHAK